MEKAVDLRSTPDSGRECSIHSLSIADLGGYNTMSYTEPTTSDLNEILDSSLDTASLQAHIDASSHDIKDIELADPTIADARLQDMHLYYAAHFASSQEQRLSSQSGESRSLSYATDESADYLEIAQRIDPTGRLAQSNKPKASLSVPDTKDIYD